MSQPNVARTLTAESPTSINVGTSPYRGGGTHPSKIGACLGQGDTADLRTKILDFRGFDSSRILKFRRGIIMPIGTFPELSQLKQDQQFDRDWGQHKQKNIIVIIIISF